MARPYSGRAFPRPATEYSGSQEGLSTRDYIAIKAMQGFITADVKFDQSAELIAEWAYTQADAMLVQRDK